MFSKHTHAGTLSHNFSPDSHTHLPPHTPLTQVRPISAEEETEVITEREAKNGGAGRGGVGGGGGAAKSRVVSFLAENLSFHGLDPSQVCRFRL